MLKCLKCNQFNPKEQRKISGKLLKLYLMIYLKILVAVPLCSLYCLFLSLVLSPASGSFNYVFVQFVVLTTKKEFIRNLKIITK